MTKLKGHALLWWDMLYKDRVNNQIEKIKTWKNMVAKIKENVLPVDYEQNVYRRVKNLREKETYFFKYNEDFFRLSLQLGIKEPKFQIFARYVNVMEYLIQGKMNTHYFQIVNEAYHISLKIEENLNRKMQKKGRGRDFRGRDKSGTTRGSEKEE